MLIVREAEPPDLSNLLVLYTDLHENPLPELDDALRGLWRQILADGNHHIFVGLIAGRIVSSLVCVVVPNLTHAQRPWAIVENVVTSPEYRHQGYATRMLDAARDLARRENCYKIMLMTGAKDEKTLKFYENAGYNQKDKTGFIQWLDA